MAPRRKVASIVAVSAVVLYLATIGHVALAPHVLCEHGELIHSAESVSPTEQRTKSPRAGLNSSIPQALVSASEGHQHCVVSSNHRNQLPDSQRSVELAADNLKAGPPAAAAIAPSGPPAIEFAPKQSPPA